MSTGPDIEFGPVFETKSMDAAVAGDGIRDRSLCAAFLAGLRHVPRIRQVPTIRRRSGHARNSRADGRSP